MYSLVVAGLLVILGGAWVGVIWWARREARRPPPTRLDLLRGVVPPPKDPRR